MLLVASVTTMLGRDTELAERSYKSDSWIVGFQQHINPRQYLIGNPPNMYVDHTIVNGDPTSWTRVE